MSAAGPPVLIVRALRKRYGEVVAVDGLDLDVARGEILGLLGPNGAGKTTTIEMIAGLVRPDSGAAEVDGLDVLRDAVRARKRRGVLLQSTGFPARITPQEAIVAFARLYGVAVDAEAMLARFHLQKEAGRAVQNLSGGQQQRLAVAVAFLGNSADTPLLLLDEPTAGLDPLMRRVVQDEIAHAGAAGRAILLATHDMAEAERLCDRLLIIDHGHVVASGTPAALVGQQARLVIVAVDRAPEGGWPESLPGLGPIAADGDGLRFATRDLEGALPRLLVWLEGQGLRLVSLRTETRTLEDVVLALAQP